MGEYDSLNSGTVKETVWLGDLPVALIMLNPDSSFLNYYIHPDTLGAPKVIMDQSKAVVWNWEHDPFGNGQPTGTLSYNMRYPGQYYDTETGLSYNTYRDYDPALGRYVQSDPIGLKGGVNTYGYVGQNPLWAIDPSGLMAGDSYPSEDAAAKAALDDVYKKSMSEGLEYGGRIYKKPSGEYSYTKPNKGTPKKVYPGECPTGVESQGYYHTHPYVYENGSEFFSTRDKLYAEKLGYPGYLATPSGRYLKYSPTVNVH